MATVRRYNPLEDRWENIASDDASGIYTDNPILTEDESGNKKSVEDILIKDREDIELLKKNVSWLALHGGGGSGSGGGSVRATITILDPADDTSEITSLVWSKDINHLSYRLASNIKTTFTITVSINNTVIQSETLEVKNYTGSIPISSINKYIGTGGTLTVTAIDLSETVFRANCRLIVSSVSLNDSSLRLTKDQLRDPGAHPLSLRYRSNVFGKYRLYYCNSMIYVGDNQVYYIDENGNRKSLDGSSTEDGQYINLDINDSNLQTIDINVVEKGIISSESDPGTYNRYFLLLNEENRLIRSSVAGVQIVILVTDGILVSPQIGSLKDPYIVSKTGIYPLQFTVFSSNQGTFSYYVNIGNIRAIDTVYGASFNKSIIVPINMGDSRFDPLEKGQKYEVEIVATQRLVSSTGKTGIEISTYTVELPQKYLEDINKKTIFNFTPYSNWNTTSTIENYEFSPNNTATVKSYFTPFRVGAGSGISDSVFYYKFRHTAFAEIKTAYTEGSREFKWFAKNNIDTNCFISKDNFQFTIQLAYHIDEENDEDATIFNLGTSNISIGQGQYILVTPHKLYIKLGKTSLTADIQDNDFTQLDIVSERVNDVYWLKVYQNAKLLAVTKFDIDGGGEVSSNDIEQIYLGCKGPNSQGVPVDSIDMDLYSVKLFSTALNAGQIVCAYINNYANYRRVDGNLPSDLITEMCNSNQIRKDSDPELIDKDTSAISQIFNFKTGEYTWGISYLGDSITLPQSIKDLPIPVVTLSVYTSGWTFDGFTRGDYNDLEAEHCPLTYKSAHKDSSEYISDREITTEATVKIQGTTTKGYDIKNLDIIFPEGTLFSPINSWFPEHQFTLKADIVDSGHINNAAIGKFVNKCFNESRNYGNTLMHVESCFPTVSKVEALKGQGKLPESVTVKAAIEGFPVLLIMDFKKGDGREIKILGIYSFNLGRESYYNQGYKVPEYFYDEAGVPYTTPSKITFPSLFGEPKSIDSSYPAYVFEGQATHNCSVTELSFDSELYDYAEIDILNGKKLFYPPVERTEDGKVKYGSNVLIDSNGNPIPYNENRVKKMKIEPNGYFWSNHVSFADSLWSFVGDLGTVNLDDAKTAFRQLNSFIATQIPYKKGSISQSDGTVVNQYRIDGTQGDTIRTSTTGQTFTITRPQAQTEIPLSVQNTAFYYVVAMLFGMVDSLGKNLQFKYWGKDGSKYWSPTFYDMDTALGIGNAGDMNVKSNVLDYSIFNTQDHIAQIMFGRVPEGQSDIDICAVYSNKLWGLENPSLVSSYLLDFTVIGSSSSSEYNPNFFAQMWHNLRTTVVKDAEDLFNNFFANHLSGCGELLMNYDYQVKYLDTTQSSFLHGNRLSFIKNWLNRRIDFLDSVFGYSQRNQDGNNYSLQSYLTDNTNKFAEVNQYNIPWRNEITLTHNAGKQIIPIKTNRDLLMKVEVGGKNVSYTYVPSGVETEIIVSEGPKSRDIQTSINNSSCITELDDLLELEITNILPNRQYTIYNSDNTEKYGDDSTGDYRYQWGSLASLKRLDLSGISTYKNDINFFRLFKTWDTTLINREPEYFSLRELNLSSMDTGGRLRAVLARTDFPQNLPQVYKEPFSKLTSINLSNSDVTDISIPSNISLSYLNLTNSNIVSISLEKQPLLSSISFAGCSALSNIQLTNCDTLEELIFDNSNISLTSITVSNCNKLKSLKILPGTDNRYTHLPEVIIESCNELEEVIVNECLSFQSNDARTISIFGCPSLKTIDLTGSSYKTIIWDKYGYDKETGTRIEITNLKLNRTEISTLKTSESEDNGVVDLTGISKILGTFSINNNPDLRFVRFDNIQNSPIQLRGNSIFSNCSSLERVYGNVEFTGNSSFSNSTKFSVLGNATSYNGYPMTEEWTYGTTTYTINKHFFDIQEIVSSDNRPVFQEGDNVSNIRLTGSSSSSSFFGTSCDVLDVYYILYNIGSGVKDISGLFRGCKKIDWNWYNSPSRHTFDKCGNITSISTIFRETSSNKFKLWSPTRTEFDQYNKDGLFSGLTNCENISQVFFGSNYVIDRHLFRKENGSYKIKSMSYFYPRFVLDDLTSETFTPSDKSDPGIDYDGLTELFNSTVLNPSEGEERDLETFGNLDGFFNNLVALTTANGIFNETKFINYNKEFNIPIGLKTLRLSFRSAYAYGDINFERIFTKSGVSFPTLGIYSSFSITTEDAPEDLRARLVLSDLTFDRFDYVTGIGYIVDSSDFSSRERCFTGMRKIITDSTFPYNIVPNKSNITIFSGIFEDAVTDSNFQETTIELPGSLFNGCKKLTDLSYLFYNFNHPYSLVGNGFKDCSELRDVRYMFGALANISGQRRRINYLEGSIPAKLFYHGEDSYTKILTGFYGSEDGIKETVEGVTRTSPTTATKVIEEIQDETTIKRTIITYSGFEYIEGQDEHTITCIPPTRITEIVKIIKDGKEESSTENSYYYGDFIGIKPKEITIDYKVPKATIDNISYCFMGSSIQPYDYEGSYGDDEAEYLSTYQPLLYLYNETNKQWTSAEQDLAQKTFMWIYDGDLAVYEEVHPRDDVSYEFLDDAKESSSAERKIYYPNYRTTSYSTDVTMKFCCAPDLLRYCKADVNPEGLFYLCGQTVGYTNIKETQLYEYFRDERCVRYGLQGRIPPYLFKPTPKIINLKNMFAGCKLLSWYSSGTTDYLIPRTLFSYITSNSLDLTRTFYALHFPSGINLDVFKGRKRTLTIPEIFRYACYDSKSDSYITIEGIFNDKSLTMKDIRSSFRISVSDNDSTEGNPGAIIRDVYVRFKENFKKNYYTGATFVYDGYRYGTVDFPGTHELPEDTGSRNYRTVGGSQTNDN